MAITYKGSIRGAGPPNYLNNPAGVFVSGNYAYIAGESDDAFIVIDISDPTTPTLKGTLLDGGATLMDSPRRIVVIGNHAFVTVWSDNCLNVVSIVDPANPVQRSFLQDDGANFLRQPIGVAISGNYAFVCASRDDALQIIDISDLDNLVFKGSFVGSAGAPNYMNGISEIIVVGNYAYCVSSIDDSLVILDITDKDNPTFKGVIQGTGFPNYLEGASGIVIKGNYAYVTAGGDDSLTVIDISDPANPTHHGKYKSSTYIQTPAEPFILPNDTDFVCVTSQDKDSLVTINISDPANPTLDCRIAGAGPPNYLDMAYHVFMVGDYAYVTTKLDDGLSIFEVLVPCIVAPTCLTQEPEIRWYKPIEFLFKGECTADGGEACEYRFQYGPTAGYGTDTAWTGAVVTDDEFEETVDARDWFKAGEPVHCRAQVKNSADTGSGADVEAGRWFE